MPSSQLVDFNHHKIRCTLHNNTWWFVISDVIAAITDSTHPANYIKDMKRRIPEFKKGWGQFASPLSIGTVGGPQKLNCADIDGLLHLLKFISPEKSEQFKKWLTFNPQFIDETRIAVIKERYYFFHSFDLRKEIAHLPTSLALYPKFLRLSNKRKDILDLIASAKMMRKSLKNMSSETKITLNQVPADLKERGYQDIKGKHSDWSIHATEEHLDILYQTCLVDLERSTKDTGGRQISSKPLHIIFRLVDIYSRGTKNKPSCGWDDVNGKHVGNFFDFIIDLLPILKSLNLRLGKPASIGTYCKEAIAHYNKVVSEKHPSMIEK